MYLTGVEVEAWEFQVIQLGLRSIDSGSVLYIRRRSYDSKPIYRKPT